MNRALILSVLVCLSVAALATEDAQAKIISYENYNDGRGNYEFSFETSNGIKHRESGLLVNIGQPDEHLEVQGEYSYMDPEGKLIVANYWANENGYHIGKQPNIPPLLGQSFGLPPAAVATLLG